MVTDSIVKKINFLDLKIQKKDLITKIGEVFVPGIANFYDYPFENKLISCLCPVCDTSVDFGIFENGGFIRGDGNSIRIKNSWVNSLTKEKVLYLSKLLDLCIKEVDKEKTYAGFLLNEEIKSFFILLKNCNSCEAKFILCFTPNGEHYNDIALQFFIHSFSQVKLSNKFLEEYIQYEIS